MLANISFGVSPPSPCPHCCPWHMITSRNAPLSFDCLRASVCACLRHRHTLRLRESCSLSFPSPRSMFSPVFIIIRSTVQIIMRSCHISLKQARVSVSLFDVLKVWGFNYFLANVIPQRRGLRHFGEIFHTPKPGNDNKLQYWWLRIFSRWRIFVWLPSSQEKPGYNLVLVKQLTS